MKTRESFSRLTAEQRAMAVSDAGTLAPLGPGASYGGAMWIGKARIHRHPVLLAFTDGRVYIRTVEALYAFGK